MIRINRIKIGTAGNCDRSRKFAGAGKKEDAHAWHEYGKVM